MTLPTYRLWMNLVIYQGIWFMAVLGRERFELLLIVPLALHFLLCRERTRELAVVAASATVGVLVDTALALGGVYLFTPEPSVLPIPLWLVGIWLGFTATLRHGLAWFVDRAPLAIAAGAGGAPLSYLAAARLGAVELPYGYWTTALIIGLAWIPLMALLILITRRLSASSQPSRTPT